MTFQLLMVLVTLSLLFVVCWRAKTPRITLRNWGSDHYSHIFSSVLFLYEGPDVYRKPLRDLCDARKRKARLGHRTARALKVPTHNVCWVKGDRFHRPLFVEWQKYPRFYPPGTILYFMPEALAYRYGASFRTICLIAIIKLVLVAHLCWVILALLLQGVRPRVLAWSVLFVAYSVLLHWSFEGMYDGISLLWLLLGMLAIKQKRYLYALVAFSGSCFFHFRALWFVPLYLYALYLAWRGGALGWLGLGSPAGRTRHWVGPTLALAVSGLAVFATAWSFIVLSPALQHLPHANPVFYKKVGLYGYGAMAFIPMTIGVCVVLARDRMWLALLGVLWLSCFLLATPWLKAWYAIHLLPVVLLAIDHSKKKRRTSGTLILLLWFLMAAQVVLRERIWPDWLAKVFQLLKP